MSSPALRAALAAAALLAAMPASAQQFSDSYAFIDAVRKADGSKVTEMLNQPGTSIVNARDRETGEGALHIVAARSDAGYLRFLLQRDANPNLTDREGNSPMMAAVNAGFAEGVAILITYRANVNLANSRGETPLIRAVQVRNLEMVRALLAAGADPDQADVMAGMSARDYARTDTRSPAIRRLMLDAPAVQRSNVAGPRL